MRGRDNYLEIHGRLPKEVKIHIYGNRNRLIIEENVTFKAGTIWFENNDCEIRIGKGTTIENAQLAVAEDGSRLTIGQDCMLSSNIRIATTDSHSVIDLQSGKRINPAANIVIEDHVWIAYNVSINKGCHIGHDSVLAGNSVVTKNVPANVIAAGIPAKIVKENITWDRKRI